jgi:hypothetical protein
MSLNDNPAVKVAYEARSYTDARGTVWRRGMDGWFDDDFEGGIYLMRHEDFVEMVEKEQPNDRDH